MHGELLAMNLSLEDVLEVGDMLEAKAGEPLPIQQAENMHCMLGKRIRDRRREVPASSTVSPGQPTNTTTTSMATSTAPPAQTAGGTSQNVAPATPSTDNTGQKSSSQSANATAGVSGGTAGGHQGQLTLRNSHLFKNRF